MHEKGNCYYYLQNRRCQEMCSSPDGPKPRTSPSRSLWQCPCQCVLFGVQQALKHWVRCISQMRLNQQLPSKLQVCVTLQGPFPLRANHIRMLTGVDPNPCMHLSLFTCGLIWTLTLLIVHSLPCASMACNSIGFTRTQLLSTGKKG